VGCGYASFRQRPDVEREREVAVVPRAGLPLRRTNSKGKWWEGCGSCVGEAGKECALGRRGKKREGHNAGRSATHSRGGRALRPLCGEKTMQPELHVATDPLPRRNSTSQQKEDRGGWCVGREAGECEREGWEEARARDGGRLREEPWMKKRDMVGKGRGGKGHKAGQVLLQSNGWPSGVVRTVCNAKQVHDASLVH
jgi:hypothetical protein